MAVEVDLFGDFVDQLRTQFNMDARLDQLEVVKKYAWFELRRIPQKKWKVYYSRELKQNLFFINNTQYIDHIRDKAESGDDLTPHASTLVDNIEERDDLLADWGIYHLHPGHGSKPAAKGFVNRAKELLFVFPSADMLYFLDVLDHNSWTNYHLIEVIDNNWPSAIDKYRLKDCIKLAIDPTEKELYELRKNQLNVSFRVGNSFFSGPGGGLAMTGAANRAVQMALNIKKDLTNYSQQLIKEEIELRRILTEKTKTKIIEDPLRIKMSRYDYKKRVVEILETSLGIELTLFFS